MTRQERWVLWVILLLIFGGLIARAWWRVQPPASLPAVPASADPGSARPVQP